MVVVPAPLLWPFSDLLSLANRLTVKIVGEDRCKHCRAVFDEWSLGCNDAPSYSKGRIQAQVFSRLLCDRSTEDWSSTSAGAGSGYSQYYKQGGTTKTARTGKTKSSDQLRFSCKEQTTRVPATQLGWRCTPVGVICLIWRTKMWKYHNKR